MIAGVAYLLQRRHNGDRIPEPDLSQLRGRDPGATTADTAVPYENLLQASRIVLDVHHLVPLLGCRERTFTRMLPTLLHLEALVCRRNSAFVRGAGDRSWRRALETILDGHGLNTRAVHRNVVRLHEYFQRANQVATGEVARTEDLVRRLVWLRSSDVRMLAHLLCAAEGRVVADQVERLLDPVLQLRTIADDLRSCGDGSAEPFNVLSEHSQLHGAAAAPGRLHEEQQRLVEHVLAFCGTMPRNRVLALWSALFRTPIPAPLLLLPGRVVAVVLARRLQDLDEAFGPIPHPE